MSSSRYTADSLTPYIPRRIVNTLLYGKMPRLIERLRGSILFVDIAGFSSLNNQIAKDNPTGNEMLMKIMIQYYSDLIEEVNRFNGTVYQFAGDSVLVAFEENGRSTWDSARHSLLCARNIHKRINKYRNVEVFDKTYHLIGKIGLGYGDYRQIILGSESHYYRAVITGESIQDAVQAQSYAKDGSIVLAESFRDIISDELICEKINDSFYSFIDLTFTNSRVEDIPFYVKNVSQIENTKFLQQFVDPLLIQKVINVEEGFRYDHREVTNVLVHIEGKPESRDSEDFIKDFNHYYNLILEESRIFGGAVIQVDITDKGNVVFVLFGAPIAQENKEVLATRLANRLLEASTDSHRFPLIDYVEIGITTGPAFCGDLGANVRKGYTVIGDDVNIATRLMNLHHRSSVNVDENTAKKINKYFYTDKYENVALKGYENSFLVHTVTGEIERLDGFLEQHTNEIIGREEEFTRLRELVKRAASGHGQIVSLTGEAGIGKSRLLQILLESITDEVDIYSGSCYHYERYTPYFPWKEIIRLVLKIFDFESIESKREIIKSSILKHKDINPYWIPVLGNLLGIHMREEAQTATLRPEQKQSWIFDLIYRLLAHKSMENPILLIFEDAHWIDEISLDLIKYITLRIDKLPIIILTANRPTAIFDNIKFYNHYNNIVIKPIDMKELKNLLNSRYRLTNVPEEFINLLMKRSGGNPFYFDTIMQSMIEKGHITYDETQSIAEIHYDDSVIIPEHLQDIVLNRIDQLNSAEKAILKTASVIGPQFEVGVLFEIRMDNNLSLPRLQGMLDNLTNNLYIAPINKDKTIYEFRNIILRDVAYETLMVATREKLHQLTANYYETVYSNNIKEKASLIAHHLYHSGDVSRAFDYSLVAARKAKSDSDFKDAIFHYERAVSIYENAIKHHALTGNLDSILEELAEMKRMRGEYAESERIYNDLLKDTTDIIKIIRLMMGKSKTVFFSGEQERSILINEELLSFAGFPPPNSEFKIYLSLLGLMFRHFFHRFSMYTNLIQLKEPDELEILLNEVYAMAAKNYLFHDYLKMAWAILKNMDIAERMHSLGELSRAYANFTLILYSRGFTKTAMDYADRAMSLAEISENITAEAQSCLRKAYLCMYLNDFQESVNLFKRGISLLKPLGEDWEVQISLFVLGNSYTYLSDFENALATYKEVERIAKKSSFNTLTGWVFYFKSFLSYMLGIIGYRQCLDSFVKAEEELKKTEGGVLPYILLVYLFEFKVEKAWNLAPRILEELEEISFARPHFIASFTYVADTAFFALLMNIDGIQKKTVLRTVRRVIKNMNNYQKRYPFYKGGLLRIRARYLSLKNSRNAARRVYKNALYENRRSRDRFELGLTYLYMAIDFKEDRKKYFNFSRRVFSGSNLVPLMSFVDKLERHLENN